MTEQEKQDPVTVDRMRRELERVGEYPELALERAKEAEKTLSDFLNPEAR